MKRNRGYETDRGLGGLLLGGSGDQVECYDPAFGRLFMGSLSVTSVPCPSVLEKNSP